MASFEDARDDIIAGFADYGGQSLTKLGFIALSALLRKRVLSQSWRMTPWQNWLRARSYDGLDGRLTAAKLLLHLNSYIIGLDINQIDVSKIGPDSSQNQCNTALRRQIDAFAGKDTRSKPKVDPPREPDPQDIVIDANNRFSILFMKQAAEDDHSFYLDEEVKMDSEVSLTLEEKRFKTQSEANATRKKMGYPPKGTASIESGEYIRIAKKAEQPDAIRILVNKVFRPLFEWRRERFIPYLEGRVPKESLTIVPLTLLGVYEQWYQTYKDTFGGHPPHPDPGCLDGVPRPWDGQPSMTVSGMLSISRALDNIKD